MRKLAVLIVLVVLALGLYVMARRRAQRQGWIGVTATSKINGVTARAPAPQVLLTDLNGQNLNTATFRGKVLLVNFWAAWCTPCADEVPQFVNLQQKYHDEGLQIIGISIDDSDSELRDFYRRYKINYPVIAGSQKIAQDFGGILGLPTTLVIRRDGDIEEKFVGATDFAMLEKHVVNLLHSTP